MIHIAFHIQSEFHSSVSYVLTICYRLHTICNSSLGISRYVSYVPRTSNWWEPSAMYYVLDIQTKRGSTKSELQILRCLSPFFVQRPLSVVYQLSYVTSWANASLILKYCLPYLYCPSLTAYMYLPTPASGYFPPLIYFITSRLGCLIFYGAILTLLDSTSM